MDFIDEAFEDDGEPIRIRTLQKLASDDALLRTKIESKLQQEFRPVDLRARIAHAEMYACGTLPGSVIEDESFHEVLSVSFPRLQGLEYKSPLINIKYISSTSSHRFTSPQQPSSYMGQAMNAQTES